MTPIEERERQHLIVLAEALGITVGELVWRVQEDERTRADQRTTDYMAAIAARYWRRATREAA